MPITYRWSCNFVEKTPSKNALHAVVWLSCIPNTLRGTVIPASRGADSGGASRSIGWQVGIGLTLLNSSAVFRLGTLHKLK